MWCYLQSTENKNRTRAKVRVLLNVISRMSVSLFAVIWNPFAPCDGKKWFSSKVFPPRWTQVSFTSFQHSTDNDRQCKYVQAMTTSVTGSLRDAGYGLLCFCILLCDWPFSGIMYRRRNLIGCGDIVRCSPSPALLTLSLTISSNLTRTKTSGQFVVTDKYPIHTDSAKAPLTYADEPEYYNYLSNSVLINIWHTK